MTASQDRSVLPGTVDLLILRALADGPAHGFGISRDLRGRSEGVVELQDAALYQALHRLSRQGWIKGEWGLSENNRRAKFYRLTPSGERRLAREEKDFRTYVAAVLKILAPAPNADGAAP